MPASSLPNVHAYLARLPDGVDSYPECQVKAAVFRDQLEHRPLPEPLLAALPEASRALALEPPPLSAWIPEVVTMAYLLAVRDHHFPPPGGDAAYETWTYERNRRLLGGRLYRAVFMLASPERLLNHIGRRWGRMRRGSRLEVTERREGFARLTTHYPPYLHDESVALGMRGAFRAAAELAGARDVRLGRPDVRETVTEITIRYTK